ncbi:MAG: EamA family transporter RarD [Kofleriaceae bacterium]|nr:EamA family transporter RarD [Kofleriaceae bacterium]
MRRGWLAGIVAYALWGVVPLYWRALHGVPPLEILAHRALWGMVGFVALAALAGQLGAVRAALRSRRVVGVMAASGALLAVNWGCFVYAVETDRLLDAALAYFINPLVSVALGTLVLGERLRRPQTIAIALATAGVVIVTWAAGTVPWMALIMAMSFALYGLVRKTAAVEALAGSTVETIILAPAAAIYLGVLAARGGGGLGHAAPVTEALLVGAGVITAVPLVFFTVAARRLPLSTVGFLQYLAPTGQFLIAVLAFGEPFAAGKLFAFALIWAGLAIFSADAWAQVRRARPG